MKPVRLILAAALALLLLPPLTGGGLTRAAAAGPVSDDNAALQYWQAFGLMSDEGTVKQLEDIDAIKFEGDAMNLVRDNNPRLAYLYAGASMPRCDWGIDFSTGPETLLPHLGRSRDLARLAVLRARYRFEQRRDRDGVDDVLATFELAKDAGETPVLICILVRYAIEQMAIDTLARHLPTMDRATLDYLATKLETLPAPDSLKRVWPQESKYFIDWTIERVDKIEKESGGDARKWSEGVLALAMFTREDAAEVRKVGVPPPKEFRALMASIKTLLAQLVDVTDLPMAEQDAKLEELQKPFTKDPLSKLLVPHQNKIFLTRRRWQVRHAMLDAAVAVVRDGEAALKEKKYADPFGDGAPFTYRKTDGGFVLESKLVFEGKPVTLPVGNKK
jgi:hypothetical protein